MMNTSSHDEYLNSSHLIIMINYRFFKEGNALGPILLTRHNISYMMHLMRSMRQAILEGSAAHEAFINQFLTSHYPAGDVPLWAVHALASVDIHVATTLHS